MTWPELLDAMERQLDAAARTVLDGAPPPPELLAVPAGPLPEELVPRATALFEATRAMEQTVGRALDDIGGTLDRVGDGRRRARQWAERSAPAYVDMRA
ncbi:MAG: hypothetical protein M0Z63_10660 [Actinomycetota bacterium]|nr:hypothetical protein [Actinomycetota bacterium]